MSRYLDGNNFYYAGVRTDGTAIIKKKYFGTYYTLSSKKIFPGVYDRGLNPNLLPKDKWIGIRSEVKNVNGESIIKLYMDENKNNNWILILEARDYKKSQGYPILSSGYTGIRTDFMDVEFDDYKLIKFN